MANQTSVTSVTLSGLPSITLPALSRVAEGTHPYIKLSNGDHCIFSSRVIPGTELSIAALQDRQRRDRAPGPIDDYRLAGANSFKDTNKVLRITRLSVAWQAVGQQLAQAFKRCVARLFCKRGQVHKTRGQA